MQQNKSEFNLNALQTSEAVAEFYNKTRFNIWGKNKEGFEALLKEEMPASAYKGISVFRPRCSDNIATVIFNGDEGDDTVYLALPNSPQCYIRVSRCDQDYPDLRKGLKVWRNGEEIREEHKKGDLVIDTGVVFHKGDDGKYQPITFDRIDYALGKAVKEAALDFEIKAISVNQGRPQKSAILYGGMEIFLNLSATNSLIQKVDSHKPEEKKKSEDVVFRQFEDGSIVTDDLVIKIGKNAKLVISGKDCSLKIVTDLGLTVKQECEYNTQQLALFEDLFGKAAMNLTENEKKKFDKDFSKHFPTVKTQEKIDALIEMMSDQEQKRTDVLFEGSKKYAVIDSFKGFDFDLVVPVEIKKSGAEPVFLSPEIQFVDEDGETKRIPLSSDGVKEKISSLLTESAETKRKFLLNFFNEEELSNKKVEEIFAQEEASGDNTLLKRMKGRCKEASVTVGFQKVKIRGTNEYETDYEKVGVLETKTFVHREEDGCAPGAKEVKSLKEKVKTNFTDALSSKFSSIFVKGSDRIVVNPHSSSGRGR